MVLIYIKRRLEIQSRIGKLTMKDVIEETFIPKLVKQPQTIIEAMPSSSLKISNASFQLDILAGLSISFKVNDNQYLDYINKQYNKNNALYLFILKSDGTPRIMESYSTGDSKDESNLLSNSIENYVYRGKLIDDKFIILFSKNTVSTQLTDPLKNTIKTALKSSKIYDLKDNSPYLLIYDLLDNNVRTEIIGDNSGIIKFSEVIFMSQRTLVYNQQGLVTTGLQCYLDATRKESYQPSFGKTWKDISGKNRHFDFQNVPNFTDGKMVQTTDAGFAIGPNADTFELSNGEHGFTIMLYSKTNTFRDAWSFWFEGKTNVHGINAHIPWSNGWVYFDQGHPLKSDDTNRIIKKNIEDLNNYHVWAFVTSYDGQLQIFKDGELLQSGKVGGATPLNLKSAPVKICYNWDANISKFLVYNTFFLPNEIKTISTWIIKDEETQKINRMKEIESKVSSKVPVKLGCQLFLDAKNYNPSSLEWKDESGNEYDFVFNKAPKVESNSIVLDGEYALSKKGSRFLNIDGDDSYTICFTSKTNQLSRNSVFKIMGYHQDVHRAIFCHPTWVNNFIYFDQAGCCDSKTQRVYTSVEKYSGEYTFYCLRKNNKERSIYINGKKITSEKTPGSSINVNLRPMIIGRDLESDYTWFANLRNFLVYNRDLSDLEIEKLSNKFYSKYEFMNTSYEGAEEFCRKKGQRLCKAEDYCIDNKPIYSYDEPIWGAISDYPDGWIQVGKDGNICKTHKDVCTVAKGATCDAEGNPTWGKTTEKEIAILCCDVKYQPLLINAIYRKETSDKIIMTFFKNNKYQTIEYELQLKSNKFELKEVSDIESISKFKGLTSSFQNGNIDAITIGKNNQESIWFTKKNVMIYNDEKQQGTEVLISNYFNNLPDDFASGYLDTVACRGYGTEYILFKKTRYCRVDTVSSSVIKHGFLKDFSGLPQEFKLGFLDCAVYSGRTDCSFLFKNDKYIEYNFRTNQVLKGPENIQNEFKYLLPPFSPENKRCSTYEFIQNVYNKDSNKMDIWKKKYYRECKNIAKLEYDKNLESYKALMHKYNSEYTKSVEDKKKIEADIVKFEQKLKEKREEWKKLENNYLELKAKPCKNDDICSNTKNKVKVCDTPRKPNLLDEKVTKKQIIIQENDIKNTGDKFYEIDSSEVNTCLLDPNIGSEFKDGFNFFAHPNISKYVEAKAAKSINDFRIQDYPGYNNYIPKDKVPKQRTAMNFDIKDHPEYYKYQSKK